MSKQVAVRGKKAGYVPITSILNSPSLRAKLQNYIDEAVRCKVKIMDENESIKTLKQAAVDDLQIDPKMFSHLTGLFFNNNFSEKHEELEQLDTAITMLMQNHIDND